MSDSNLEDILKECTNRNDAKLSDHEKVFDKLWQDQKERLNKHEKYIAESTEIKPIPVFVCKTKMRKKNESIDKSQKAFLNICSHHLIPNLSVQQIDVNNNGKKEQGIRFPMSCGSKMETRDNNGNIAYTYDVVFHPDIIQYANDDYNYKINICETAAQNISQKENIIIENTFKFPKCVYKGTDINHKTPFPQRIRKTGAAKFVQEQPNGNNYTNNDLHSELELNNDANIIRNDLQLRNLASPSPPPQKTNIATNNTKDDDTKSNEEGIKLKYKFYMLFRDDRKKMLINDACELKEYLNKFGNENKMVNEISDIQIHIDLTKRFELNQMDLNTNKNGVYLKFNHKTLFMLEWTNISSEISEFVNCDKTIAKFVKKKNLLKITCPFVSC